MIIVYLECARPHHRVFILCFLIFPKIYELDSTVLIIILSSLSDEEAGTKKGEETRL